MKFQIEVLYPKPIQIQQIYQITKRRKNRCLVSGVTFNKDLKGRVGQRAKTKTQIFPIAKKQDLQSKLIGVEGFEKRRSH